MNTDNSGYQRVRRGQEGGRGGRGTQMREKSKK